MGLDFKIPKLPPIASKRLLSLVILIGFFNTTLGVAYIGAKSSEITVLHVEGAPDNLVFIADPHLREGNIEATRRIIDEINALDPALVFILGDFVYGNGEDLYLQDVWSRIDAPVYAILGNHDYMSGTDAMSWLRKNDAVSSVCLDVNGYNLSGLRDETTDLAFAEQLVAVLGKNGVTVMRNEYLELELEGRDLMLVGVDDGWAGMADPPAVPQTDAYVLYMIHEPDCRADWDADLTIAGHTHGGQFLPKGINILGKEISGLYERNGKFCYVTRGIGTSSFSVELRMFATPEIVVINPSTPPEEILPGKKIVHITIE